MMWYTRQTKKKKKKGEKLALFMLSALLFLLFPSLHLQGDRSAKKEKVWHKNEGLIKNSN